MTEFNVGLPSKRNNVSTRVKSLLKGKLRVAIVKSYNPNKGFIVTIAKHRSRVELLLPKEILTLTGRKLYSLPSNNKHDIHWTKVNIGEDYVFDKPEIVHKYWTNLKPQLKIIISIVDDKIISYEQYV